LFEGYGYEVTSADVWAAYEQTMIAAGAIGEADFARSKILEAVKVGLAKGNWVADVLARAVQAK